MVDKLGLMGCQINVSTFQRNMGTIHSLLLVRDPEDPLDILK